MQSLTSTRTRTGASRPAPRCSSPVRLHPPGQPPPSSTAPSIELSDKALPAAMSTV